MAAPHSGDAFGSGLKPFPSSVDTKMHCLSEDGLEKSAAMG
jgi:hypothetical protein